MVILYIGPICMGGGGGINKLDSRKWKFRRQFYF